VKVCKVESVYGSFPFNYIDAFISNGGDSCGFSSSVLEAFDKGVRVMKRVGYGETAVVA